MAQKKSNFNFVLRGVHTDAAEVQEHYSVGRTIHWSAFTSTTTDVKVAKGFTGSSKVLFRITIVTGKDIMKYSVIKGEKEILLNPNMSFVVFKKPTREEDGYFYVDMVQRVDSDTYIF